MKSMKLYMDVLTHTTLKTYVGHSWQRGPNHSYFMKTSPLLPTPPPPFQYLSNPPSLSPPNPTPTAISIVLFLWLNGWSSHTWCAVLVNDIMDLHMSSLGTLVPEGPWCVFYATRHEVYWGLTYNVAFCWYSYLISHTQTHTGPSRLTHPYKYIFIWVFFHNHPRFTGLQGKGEDLSLTTHYHFQLLHRYLLDN